jgi:hypothetical protein
MMYVLPWVYYHENTRFYLRFYTNKTLLFIVKYENNHALLTAFSRMALWATFGTGCPNYYPGYTLPYFKSSSHAMLNYN